ncbi:MAG: hypothetical protein ABI134_17410, partial [Byssovorax sp.]
MVFVPHWYKLHHGTGVALRIFVNDILLYRHSGRDNWTFTGPANHLFVPGENTLRVELFPTIAPAHAPKLRGPVEVRIMADAPKDVIIAEYDFSWWDAQNEPPLPTVGASVFRPDGDIPEPAWQSAPRERFGPEGTPELRAAAQALHEAFAKRDVDAYFEAHRVRLEQWQRAYPESPAYDPSLQRARLADAMKIDWVMPPFDADALVFEPQADGRVAYV